MKEVNILPGCGSLESGARSPEHRGFKAQFWVPFTLGTYGNKGDRMHIKTNHLHIGSVGFGHNS